MPDGSIPEHAQEVEREFAMEELACHSKNARGKQLTATRLRHHFLHKYGRHVGGVPRSSWAGWKLCILVTGKGSKPKTREPNTKTKPKLQKKQKTPEDPNNQCGQSFDCTKVRPVKHERNVALTSWA